MLVAALDMYGTARILDLLLQSAEQPDAGGIDIRDPGEIERQVPALVGRKLVEILENEMYVGASPIAFEMHERIRTMSLVVHVQ